ncbi:MAG: hypothetical protein JKY93_03350 [Gammaproteobacteria bacterium]|nr:hypothetical protein [Gammaproteobacteria bacterium]
MAYAKVGQRGDIVVQVELDPDGQPGVFTSLCAVTGASISISNEIISVKTSDCADWSAAIQTVKQYGATDASMTIDANWTAESDKDMLQWSLLQKSLRTRLLYPNATSGLVANIDGVALMEGYSTDGIGNEDGNPQTQSLSLQFSGLIVPAYAA